VRLLFFILFLNLSFSQPYKPLLDQTNQWHFTTCYFGCLTDTYFTNGDTIVDGNTYKVLDGYHFISRTFLLREDVPAKKVYFKKANPNFIREYLLYDFTLQEGDDFEMKNPFTPFPIDGGEFHLDSIRMKPLLNNIDYKHFYFSPTASNTVATENVVWIEGIGGKSLINAPGGEANINGAGQLSCFFKNDELVYSNLDSISGCTYQNLNTITPLFSNTKILKTDKKRVFDLTNTMEIKAIDVFSISGQKIKSFQNDNNSTIVIPLEEFTSGLYFVEVYDAFYRRKVFKVISE
jgi:hypothetical protein